MDSLLTIVLVFLFLYNIAAIAWEYLIHRQLTKLEEKQANMQVGFKQMSERLAWVEETVYEINRKNAVSPQKTKIVRKKQ